MSALADVLLDLGVRVSGSDLVDGKGLARLRGRGVSVAVGMHARLNLPHDTSRVVISAAVPADNPEVLEATARGLPVRTYAQQLGDLMRDKVGVAIGGTHGKTTTTAMVAFALRTLGHAPSFVVGGEVGQLGGAGAGGTGPHFVAEACEYRESFLSLVYQVAAITNIEADHLDYFGDDAALIDAFGRFVAAVPPRGAIVATTQALAALPVADVAARQVVSVGVDDGAHLHAADYRIVDGRPRFRLAGLIESDPVHMTIPGRHFVEDLLIACGVVHALGVDAAAAAHALGDFAGVGRRMEVIVASPVGTLMSDYAHHPTELRAVLDALRDNYPGRRLVGVFQPHQAGRTRHFMNDFATALSGFDLAVIPDIFVTRDSDADARAVNSQDLVNAVTDAGGAALYAGALEETAAAVLSVTRAGDVVVLLGAGTIDALRHELEPALSVAQ